MILSLNVSLKCVHVFIYPTYKYNIDDKYIHHTVNSFIRSDKHLRQ